MKRIQICLLAGAAALLVPRIGLSDVALPTAAYTKADPEEACPLPEDLTLDDVDITGGGGCTATAIDGFFEENETTCFYSVFADCGPGGTEQDGPGCG